MISQTMNSQLKDERRNSSPSSNSRAIAPKTIICQETIRGRTTLCNISEGARRTFPFFLDSDPASFTHSSKRPRLFSKKCICSVIQFTQSCTSTVLLVVLSEAPTTRVEISSLWRVRQRKAMKASDKLVVLGSIFTVGAAGQNFDLFNYGSSNRNENGIISRGQPDWDQVRCGDDTICVSLIEKKWR